MRTPSPSAPLCAPKKVLLVDDHPVMREGLAKWINQAPDLAVCGEAADAAEALALLPKLRPDVVVTDLTLPGKSGLELIKDLAVLHPSALVLVLSMHDEGLYAERVLRAGARGYVMKSAGGDKVVAAVRRVLAGEICFSPAVSTSLLEAISGRRKSGRPSAESRLTDRELEVLELLGQAKTNREIAAELHLSPKTVETHRLNLRTKLALRTTAELVRYAIFRSDADPGRGASASPA